MKSLSVENSKEELAFWLATKLALQKTYPDLAEDEDISTRAAEGLIGGRYSHAQLWNKAKEGYLRKTQSGSLFLKEIESLQTYFAFREALKIAGVIVENKNMEGDEVIAVLPKHVSRLTLQAHEEELKASVLALKSIYLKNFYKQFGIIIK